MSSARNIVVTGGSAGGLATLWRCNEFQKFFPLSSIKCIVDSAYFVDTQAENGRKLFFDRMASIDAMHDIIPDPIFLKL